MLKIIKLQMDLPLQIGLFLLSSFISHCSPKSYFAATEVNRYLW